MEDCEIFLHPLGFRGEWGEAQCGSWADTSACSGREENYLVLGGRLKRGWFCFCRFSTSWRIFDFFKRQFSVTKYLPVESFQSAPMTETEDSRERKDLMEKFLWRSGVCPCFCHKPLMVIPVKLFSLPVISLVFQVPDLRPFAKAVYGHSCRESHQEYLKLTTSSVKHARSLDDEFFKLDFHDYCPFCKLSLFTLRR